MIIDYILIFFNFKDNENKSDNTESGDIESSNIEFNESFKFDKNESDNTKFEFDNIYEDYSTLTFKFLSYFNKIFTDN